MNICLSCCKTVVSDPDACLCDKCLAKVQKPQVKQGSSLAQLYPQYYKSVRSLDEVDVYAVHQLFNITDPSGAIQHASKKLLLSGVRTGNKSKYKDVQEARDTLNRWLQLQDQFSLA